METQVVKKFKWFWAWQDEKEENWLSEMSRQGFHLKTPGFFGSYEFTVGNPIDYIYQLDFITSSNKDMAAYLQLFKDMGWDYLGNMGGWQYFRTEVANGDTPQIFSDNVSKIQKYQRIIGILLIYLPIYMIYPTILNKFNSLFMDILTLFFTFILIIFSVAILCLIRRISELKKKI
jgi:hypothetical protein